MKNSRSLNRLVGDVSWRSSMPTSKALPGFGNVCDDILKETCSKFADQCLTYSNTAGELAFTYSERQLAGVLIPALLEVVDAVFPEQPIRRKSKVEGRSKDASGWVDYWISKADGAFLVELKHSNVALRVFSPKFEASDSRNPVISEFQGSSLFNQSTSDKWEGCIQQNYGFEAGELREAFTNSTSKDDADNKLAVISLQVMPAYLGAADSSSLFVSNGDEDNCYRLGDDAVKQLIDETYASLAIGSTEKPNFVAVWRLGGDFDILEEYDNWAHIYPAVIFAAHVRFPLV